MSNGIADTHFKYRGVTANVVFCATNLGALINYSNDQPCQKANLLVFVLHPRPRRGYLVQGFPKKINSQKFSGYTSVFTQSSGKRDLTLHAKFNLNQKNDYRFWFPNLKRSDI